MLLVDTYDTVAGARRAVAAAKAFRMKGVRLDSGDLASLSRQVRAVLDEAGLRDAIIFASGNLDEYRVADLVASGAPIDSFGIGTTAYPVEISPALQALADDVDRFGTD